MFETLSARTRKLIARLLRGESVSISGSKVGPYSEQVRVALRILIDNREELSQLKGAALADSVVNIHEAATAVSNATDTTHEFGVANEDSMNGTQEPQALRLSRVRACSFRGIAPAGEVWEYDFAGQSHIMHSPNGGGKSSLLGAITWCLTGRVLRDDCPPSSPGSVETYARQGNQRSSVTRPDALALLHSDGSNTDPEEDYWVQLQFRPGNGDGATQGRWLRRCQDGSLSSSDNGEVWETIHSIEEFGISELDAELFVLMPARVSHLSFGKNPELISVFSQIVGLDDLEHIAELASKTCTELRKAATKLKKGELAKQLELSHTCLEKISDVAPEYLKGTAEFAAVWPKPKGLGAVTTLGKVVSSQIDDLRKGIAQDLGIEIPEENSEEYEEFKEALVDLPGLAQGAMNFLDKPLEDIYKETLSLTKYSAEELEQFTVALQEFESRALSEVAQRLDWARKEHTDSKQPLMLMASEHFDEDTDECPVCAQDLAPVPQIRKSLVSLKELAALQHLKKEIADHARELMAALDRLLPEHPQDLAEKSLSDLILADWKDFKESVTSGQLLGIAKHFDSPIKDLAKLVSEEESPTEFALKAVGEDEFLASYQEVESAVSSARQYLALLRSFSLHEPGIRDTLTRILCKREAKREPPSLYQILEQGRAKNDDLRTYETLRTDMLGLYTAQKEAEKLSLRVSRLRQIADATEELKELEGLVRDEVSKTVNSLHHVMKEFYEKLYTEELLPFGLLTSGHARNPRIKDQTGAYLEAGGELVPIAPFSNAGRLRALALSFVFALMRRSRNSLGIVVLDDPALSLDDQHKARFLTHLVAPMSTRHQIILATHYEPFFTIAQRHVDGECVRMTPRRSNANSISFEPGDLLERVEAALTGTTTGWQEAAVDLRKWVERVLKTLNAYSPELFWVKNDFSSTLRKYGQVSDRRVATKRRTQILEILNDDLIEDLHRFTAHEGDEPAKTDIEDLHDKLKKCKKSVVKEIETFKEHYYHDLEANTLDLRPVLELLRLKERVSIKSIDVAGMAAASERGTGVTWEENTEVCLDDFQIAVARLDSIAPIALPGQTLLLDTSDEPAREGDLVAVKTPSGKRFLRRFWRKEDQSVYLESVNLTCLYEPVVLESGESKLARVIGVLFTSESFGGGGSPGDEWIDPGKQPSTGLTNLLAVRVNGNSMAPLALDQQLVLVEEPQSPLSISDGELVCADIENEGTVLKRLFKKNGECHLGSINQTDVYPPIIVSMDMLRKAWVVKGVLFEYGSALTEKSSRNGF